MAGGYIEQVAEILGGLPPAMEADLPLAIGSKEELAARLRTKGMAELDAIKLAGRCLGVHVRRDSYFAALAAEGAMRVNLDGAEVEPVSMEHQMVASNMYLGRMLFKHRGTLAEWMKSGAWKPKEPKAPKAEPPRPVPVAAKPRPRSDVKTRF